MQLSKGRWLNLDEMDKGSAMFGKIKMFARHAPVIIEETLSKAIGDASLSGLYPRDC